MKGFDMRSSSQSKVSLLSFLIAFLASLVVFGVIAGVLLFTVNNSLDGDSGDKENEISDPAQDMETVSPGTITPDEAEKIEGESFTVLVAGYDLAGIGFDAMLVVDVNKETQKVSVYPINTDTKVYVGHGDSNSLNVRIGDLIKYKDMQYVLDKLNATAGLKIEYYITFTAEDFVKAFDEFNKNGDYEYKVTKAMSHTYVELPEGFEEAFMKEETEGEEGEQTASPAAPVTPVTPATPEAPAEGEAEEDSFGLTPEEIEELKTLAQYNFSFKKGEKLTSGIDVYNMLRYKGDSESDRMTRQANFARDVVTKIIPNRFKEGELTAVLDTFKAATKLTESVETNITIETFITQTFDLIAAMPEFALGTITKYTSGITNFK